MLIHGFRPGLPMLGPVAEASGTVVAYKVHYEEHRSATNHSGLYSGGLTWSIVLRFNQPTEVSSRASH